jgi:Double zinc ribbon
MSLLALFGIDNDGLNLAVNLLVVFLVIVYLALIVWTYLDARRRIEDSWLVACATAAAVFPFVGALVYSILRPPEFTEDRKERELEIRAAELRVKQLGEQSCPNCEFPVERSYLRCPNCEARLKDPCPSCSKPIDPRWAMCPYCETPIRRRAPERRPRAQRRARADREPPSRAAREAAREQARAGRQARQASQPSPQPPAKRPTAPAGAAGRSGGGARASSPSRSGSPPEPGRSDTRPTSGDSQPPAERRPVRSPSRSSDKPDS